MRDTIGLPVRAIALAAVLLVVLLAPPAGAAEWYTVNAVKHECERANRTDFPTPDDFADFLRQQNRYRNKKVVRDFTGRAQIVTFTDIDNHEMEFFVDQDTCQRTLRRTRNSERFGDLGLMR